MQNRYSNKKNVVHKMMRERNANRMLGPSFPSKKNARGKNYPSYITDDDTEVHRYSVTYTSHSYLRGRTRVLT